MPFLFSKNKQNPVAAPAMAASTCHVKKQNVVVGPMASLTAFALTKRPLLAPPALNPESCGNSANCKAHWVGILSTMRFV
jgi:hypothetical protein|mmetsp:Transcript_9874/g.22381  ORF Transcript_9874/g.22381 Transcript_9874/m.22381 type:complete len:80 (+) Transcript_9874:490-729(+)